MKVVRVRVWYEDGPHDGWDGPDDGVQVVTLEYDNGGSRIMNGYDYYFRADGPADYIYGGTNDLKDIDRYQNPVVLRGRWTDDATFHAIQREAQTYLLGG